MAIAAVMAAAVRRRAVVETITGATRNSVFPSTELDEQSEVSGGRKALGQDAGLLVRTHAPQRLQQPSDGAWVAEGGVRGG
ncbi:hypothetical protein [Streptomyces sp. NPDC005244]|uniref:hypothetical protein n=1 Tax=Streptomyces sp. NPDC005244 TaxID=3364708 RepID=UPI0036BF9D86